jgi:hypothetical protein
MKPDHRAVRARGEDIRERERGGRSGVSRVEAIEKEQNDSRVPKRFPIHMLRPYWINEKLEVNRKEVKSDSVF